MVGGIRSMRMLAAAAALGLMDGPALRGPIHGIPIAPNPRRDRLWHEAEARDRARRRKAREEERERVLRQRIAKGQDDRADKYLHSAARRRRAAERASLTTSEL
jgi:hypothetical protein